MLFIFPFKKKDNISFDLKLIIQCSQQDLHRVNDSSRPRSMGATRNNIGAGEKSLLSRFMLNILIIKQISYFSLM